MDMAMMDMDMDMGVHMHMAHGTWRMEVRHLEREMHHLRRLLINQRQAEGAEARLDTIGECGGGVKCGRRRLRPSPPRPNGPASMATHRLAAHV